MSRPATGQEADKWIGCDILPMVTLLVARGPKGGA